MSAAVTPQLSGNGWKKKTLDMLYFHFLFTRQPTPRPMGPYSLFASERYGRLPLLRVMKSFIFFGIIRALSRHISRCFVAVLLPVLARARLLVMFLRCILQSSVSVVALEL